MDWHHAVEGIATALASLLNLLSRGLELFIDKIEPHPNAVAAIIYLVIVVFIALVVAATRSVRHINQMRAASWNTSAAKHAWALALIMFLANGVLHALEQTKLLAATPFDASKAPFVAHLTANTLLWLVVNLVLWFVVLISYWNDARNWQSDNGGRALKYFGTVFAAFAFEDFINMNWEHYGTKERIGELLRWLHSWSGQYILIAISVFILLVWIALRRPSVKVALEDSWSRQM